MPDSSFLQRLLANPRSLFVIDGAGALISAIMLGIVLVALKDMIGMPAEALYILAALPVGFALYDAICYWAVQRNFTPFLKGIALINIGYCGFSAAFLSQYHERLTTLGWIYFIGEILLVLLIAGLEWYVAGKIFTAKGQDS